MCKVGIITYHSAYNFGSALQAYATQQMVNRIAGSSEIINYRLKEQNYYYKTLYRTKYGPKVLLKDLMMVPVCGKRIERAEKFEDFIISHFTLTDEMAEPEEVRNIWDKYDVIVSGSDQIFSKRSNELRYNEWKYMDPYLLEGYQGRKISYASSVGGAFEEDIQHIIPSLESFNDLSFREESVAHKIGGLLNKSYKVVLDPTFLLTKEEWMESFNLKKTNDEKFILVYSLRNPQTVAKLIKPLRRIARKMNCKVKMVTPFTYIPVVDSSFEIHPEFGPIDFLTALYNAEYVITDSYHGTILSVNMNKSFYSLCGDNPHELRKLDILNRLELVNRVVYGADQLSEELFDDINYERVNAFVSDMRDESLAYLRFNLK